MTKIVTIEQARQKLGERGKRMTDQEIADLLIVLRRLCSNVIDSVIEKSHTEVDYAKSTNLLSS